MAAKDTTPPVPFITYDPASDKFSVSKDGARRLQAIKGKIAVVCVAGPYRTGKSFLLNQLVGTRTGFAVGATVRACTKGIWLWGEPVAEEGKTLVFIDTEGLGSIEAKSATFDTQIFSLAVLLSSLFILNTQGTINETALEQLQLVVNVAKKIKVRETGRGRGVSAAEQDAALAAHFPNFLWVLRDFVLQLETVDGQPMTSREYLEDALRVQPGGRGDPQVAQRNAIRQTLSSVFPHRDCVTLVRPVTDEKQLQKAHELPYDSLRREFRNAIADLRGNVIRTAPLKQIEGAFVNGPALVRLAEQYVAALNTGAVPTIQTAWASVVAVQNREALDKALEHYNAQLRTALPDRDEAVLGADRLEEAHRAAEAAAVAIIHETAVGDDDQTRELLEHFRREVDTRHGAAIERNRLRSRVVARKSAEDTWKRLKGERRMRDSRTIEDFDQLMAEFRGEMEANPAGPCTEDITRELVATATHQRVGAMYDQVMTLAREKEQHELAVAAKQAELERALQGAAAVSAELKERKAEVKRLEAEAKATSTEVKQQQAEVKRVQDEMKSKDTQIKDLRAELKRAEDGVKAKDAEIKELKAEVKRAAEEVKAKDAEVKAKDAELKALRKENKTLTTQLQQAEQLQRQATAASGEAEAAGERVAALGVERDRLSARVNELTETLRARDGEKRDLEAELRQVRSDMLNLRAENNHLQDSAFSRKAEAPPSGRKRRLDDDDDDNDGGGGDAFVAPTPVRAAAAVDSDETLEDAEARLLKSTIQQLKSWLTDLDVVLPATAQPRAHYVDLLRQHHPLLRDAAPPAAAAAPASAAKRRRK